MRKLIIATSFIICLLATSLVLVKAGSSSSPLRIYVDPPESTVNPGDSFQVDVRIDNAQNVWVYEFYLAWKSGLLNATEVVEGDFPGRGGIRKTVFMPPKIFNDKGYVYVAAALLGEPWEGEDGSGTLATINFTVNDAGETGLHLFDVGVADPALHDIDFTLEDGYVNTVAPKIRVDPSTIIDAALVPGESLSVNLSISNIEELRGYSLKLSYDVRVLNATNVSVAPFLKEPFTVNKKEINSTQGFVWINVASTAEESISGSGILANMTFTVLEVGSSLLDIYDVRLDDRLARLRTPPFQHDGIGEDGFFSNIPAGHDIVVKKITVLPVNVTVGETISINVTVVNAGAFNETFDVTVYYDSNVIQNQTDINLETAELKLLTFSWDTTDVPAGAYTVKAEASVVEGETKKANNVKEFPRSIYIEGEAESNFMLYVGIGIVVVVIVLALFLVVKMRKP